MTNPTVTAREALELHVAYEALPADRGGKNGPKGRAWSAFIEARDAALSALDAGPVGVGVIGRDALVDAAADHPRLGQQLVSNRGFAVSTGWTLGANFTITGGVLRSSAGSVAKGWGDTHDPNARPLYTKETILSALSLSEEPTKAGWRPMETAPEEDDRQRQSVLDAARRFAEGAK